MKRDEEPGASPPRAGEDRLAIVGDDRAPAAPLFVGVAGGSGSGKTTVVEKIMSGLAPRPVTLIHHDAYYFDYEHLDVEERAAVNFDHPASLETTLLIEHLDGLARARSLQPDLA